MSKSRKSKRQPTVQRQQQRSTTTISLCVIARDEEAMIGKCLESARPFVDEIVVVDTGSVDRTREIALEHGARVEHFTWCDDFAAARNASIDQATGEWILVLDADEELDQGSGPLLRPLIANIPLEIHSLAPRIDSVIRPDAPDGFLTSHHTRLFRRRPDVRFVGAIHEQIKYLPAPEKTLVAQVADIRITHSGYIPEHYRARGKDDRNTRILERTLEERPDDAALLFHMGLQHSAMDRHADTVVALTRSIELAGDTRPWFLVDAYARLINALIGTGQTEILDRVVERADRANLMSKKAREQFAQYLAGNERFTEAEHHLLAALNPECPTSLTEFPGAGTWGPRVVLGRLYERTQRMADSLEQFELALAHTDLLGRQRVLIDASRVAHKLSDRSRAAGFLAEAMAEEPDDIEGQLALLKLSLVLLADGSMRLDDVKLPAIDVLLARQDWQAAYDAALAMPPTGVRALARFLHLAEQLLDRGAPDAALDVLGYALDTHSSSANLYWLLVRVFAKVDRYDDALAAIEILRALPDGERQALALSLEFDKAQWMPRAA